MASTYTVNLGIEKIGTGEQSGTWGTTTNTNFDLIDQAVNGIVQVTLPAAGSSGSPKALTITNGTASDGRNKYIEFVDGGDLGATAYVQLQPNDAEKIVHMRNSLSGGRSVIIFQGTYNASNDFEIPNGKDVVLKFDGGGASATVTQVFEDLLVTAVAATTVDTTNIEVTNLKAKDGTSAGSIADSTGVVTIASSVLTTADINGGTIDGVTIGGSSAGAITGTTGQFNTSLNVDGTVTADGLTVDNSIATIQNSSDGTALRLSSTQNDSAHSTTTPFGEVQFYSGDASSPGAGVRASIGGYPFDTGASGGGVIKIQTADSGSLKERLSISPIGDISFYEDTGTTAKFFWDASAEALGIGTSSPAYRLDIARSTSNTLRLLSTATSVSAGNLLNQIIFENSDDSGNIEGNYYIKNIAADGFAATNLDFRYDRQGTEVSLLAFNDNAASGRQVVVNDDGDSNVDFRVESDNNANAIFVDAGNDVVNIGTSGLSVSGAKLAVQGPAAFNTDGGSNKVFITRLGNTSETGSMYTDDKTFVFDSQQDESTGDAGSFLFRSTNGAASDVVLLTLEQNEAIFNEGGADVDFRVESDSNTHMLFVDAGNDRVGVGHNNPSADLDVKGEQVLRGLTNGGGITQMADSGSYTTSLSATNIFQISGLSNNSAEITIIFSDVSFRNGSFIQKLYVSTDGSGANPAATNLVVENKSREVNGTFPSHFTWTATPSGSYVIFAATADETISGAGTIFVHVNCIGSTGGKSLEMLI